MGYISLDLLQWLGPLWINGQFSDYMHLRCSNGFETYSIGFRRPKNPKNDFPSSAIGLQLIQA